LGMGVRKDIVILGAGGFAREVAFLIEEINRDNPSWNILGFISKNRSEIGNKIGKISIYDVDDSLITTKKKIHVAAGIGNPQVLQTLLKRISENPNLDFPNLIHPGAIGDWQQIKLGAGNIICAGNILTTDISIGSFNIFNLSCTLGHDARIGSFNVFNPTVNLSGGINIKNCVLVGTGAKILQNLSICSDCIIGAGAIVTKNIETPGTYIGIPAVRKR